LTGNLRAVLLTGPVASGKTVVAQEVVAIAEERGLHAAAVDLDWLGWATGGATTVDAMIAANLAAVAANYARWGISRLVVARALVGDDALAHLAESLPAWRLSVATLEAPRATLERRLRRRDTGAELEHNLLHLDLPMSAPGGAIPVRNDGRTVRDVALDVMAVAGWI
jgi:hypothetical protein